MVRLGQQVARADGQKHPRERGQEESEHRIVQLREGPNCRADRWCQRIQEQQDPRGGHPSTPSQRKRDHVHPVGEVMGQHCQANQQTHSRTGPKGKSDRQPIHRAVGDEADRANNAQRRRALDY